MNPLWPHQERGLAELREIAGPGQRICVTAPTGAGKSRMMIEMLRESEGGTLLLTNRRMLLAQISGVLEQSGISHGIIAAGYEKRSAPVQLATVQTLLSRAIKKKRSYNLPPASTVITDEAHVIKEASAQAIYDSYPDACKVGFTATPLDIGHLYDHLVVAGKPSELRGYGTLVPAVYYAPDEPDTKSLKRTKTGEYTEGDVVKAIMNHTIAGRVIDNYHRLNPDGLPSLLFAPGVRESQWFAERLSLNGIPAAHIDGEQIWHDGMYVESTDENRELVTQKLRDGEIKVLCNRFVLREGIDLPYVQHIICATIFGGLTSYLQSLGRGLRACPSVGKEQVVIQDHGGNWHRHGSINADRDWLLEDTAYVVGEIREDGLRNKSEDYPEPINCPKCSMVRMSGPKCPGCGYQHHAKSRMVVQTDGRLKQVDGDIYRPHWRDKTPGAAERWERTYWACYKKKVSLRQGVSWYCYHNDGKHPPIGVPFMPKNERDWFIPANEIPRDRLIPKPGAEPRRSELFDGASA